MKTALISFTFVLLISSAAFAQGPGRESEQRQQNMIDQSNEYLLKQQQSQQMQRQPVTADAAATNALCEVGEVTVHSLLPAKRVPDAEAGRLSRGLLADSHA